MRRLALAATFAVLAAPALAQAPQCEIDRPVMFADLNYDSAQFHTEIAKFIIEHGYGCSVDAIPGDTIPLINGVARGDADIIMEIWTANPAQAWVDAEQAGQTVAMGTTFESSLEGWFVPTSLVSGEGARAPELKSVTDLPRYKELFEDPEEPGKGRFYNCPAGWQCEVVNSKKLIAYGLEDHFTNFRPGTGTALAAAADAAALRERPVLFYYWGPTWLLGKHDFTQLEEPPFDKAVWDRMLESAAPEQATAYPVSAVIIGANKAFTEAAPNLAAFLKAYDGTVQATQAALAEMQETNAPAAALAKKFLAGDESWTNWVPEEVAAAVKAAL